MAIEGVEVTCYNQFDPPIIRVVVLGMFLGDYPRHDYDRIAPALGLPKSQEVCDEYNDGV